MRTKLTKALCKVVALSMTVSTMFAGNGIVANAQPKVMKDGTIFDAEYYAQRYADVVAVYGTDENALFQHYTDFGKAENREGVKTPSTSTFDPVYYAKQNPDVVAVYGNGNNNLYQHYLQHGIQEGRKPTANAKGGTSNTASTTTAPAVQPTETPTQATAPVQANSISDAEALQICKDYLNNIVANTPDSVCAFFDTDGNHTIADMEMLALIAWTLDNYNKGDRGKITEDEMIAVGRAIHDGTFKRPDSPYNINI